MNKISNITIVTLSFLALSESIFAAGKFQLLTVPLNEGTMGIAKCNTKSGEGWYKMDEKWVKGVDVEPIPESSYVCATPAFKEKGWLIVRMDENTGTTWVLEGANWKKILD